jgi:hypothetical protein
MKTRIIFRFSVAVVAAVITCLKAGKIHSINIHHHFKKRKNNELSIFTT